MAMQALMFWKRQKPEELVKKWQQDLRKDMRDLDRQIQRIAISENKAKRELQLAGKRKDITSCKSLAKEIVRARHAITRIHTMKAQLNSLSMQLQNQLAHYRLSGTLEKSAELMKVTNNLTRIPELSQQMSTMQNEMIKTGIIEEMMDDVVDNAFDDVEEEAEEEINKIILEVNEGVVSSMDLLAVPSMTPTAPGISALPKPTGTTVAEDNMDKIQERLKALGG